MKGGFFSFLRVAISISLLALLFWLMRGDIANIWVTIVKCNLRYIAAGLLLLVVNVYLLAYRMKIIFEGEDLTVDVPEALQLTYVGYFFNNFMPTAVGGDIIKAHYAARSNGRKLKSYASVLMDRFIGLYSFLIVAGIALIVDWGRFQIKMVRPLVFTLLAVGFAGFVVATNTIVAGAVEKLLKKLKMMRLGEKIHAVYSIVHDYRNRGGIVARSMVLSIVAQSIYFVVVYLFFLSLGYRVSMGNIFLIMPVVTFISMLPSLGGLGVREGATVALFSHLVGKEAAFAASILLLFSLFFLSLIGGLIYVWWGITGVRKKGERAVEEETPEFIGQ